ncbi:MAG: hypothetical protein WBB67_00350 [bacterium]
MGLFDDLKSIAEVLQEANKIEQYKQILDIQQQLLEMQKKMRAQVAEIEELQEKLKIKGDILFKNPAYWIKKKDGLWDGPFCPTCWDGEKKLIRLVERFPGRNILRCNICKISVSGVVQPT